MKDCLICGEEKANTKFPTTNTHPRNWSYCKSCIKSIVREIAGRTRAQRKRYSKSSPSAIMTKFVVEMSLEYGEELDELLWGEIERVLGASRQQIPRAN